MFKVRKWSTSNALPYDVVFIDFALKKVYYQPHITFRTKTDAERYKITLDRASYSTGSFEFVRENWPEEPKEEPKEKDKKPKKKD
jgi:hypothetical protein